MIAKRALFGLISSVLLSAAALADTTCVHGEKDRRTINTVGEASARVPADVAEINVGIKVKGSTRATALDMASKAVTKVVAIAKDAGVEPVDIGTSSVTLVPLTRTVSTPNGSRDEPDGYQAINSVSIRLSDLARLGDVLRQAVDAGANQIDGVTFGLRDPAKLEAELRIAATQDAVVQARAMVEAAGAQLGAVTSLSGAASINGVERRNSGLQAYRFSGGSRDDVASKRVSIAAGAVEVSFAVRASFDICP